MKFQNLSEEISFLRVNNDTNGNPRYAFHYLELSENYSEALQIAKQIGGKKFHNRQFGGGIVIQSYNLIDDVEKILLISGKAIQCHRKPTKYELKQGYGATHYRTFLKSDITKKDGQIKRWFKADDDLIYSTK